MQNDVLSQDTSHLSYLDASKVTSPAGVLAGLDVLTIEGKRLGCVKGVVIDAAARRVRYLAVQASGWFRPQRYLVEADQLAQLEGEHKALRLRGDIEDEAVLGLDAAALRRFSDDDLLDAMFAPRPA